MSPERLEEIRKRTEAATPGPWSVDTTEAGTPACFVEDPSTRAGYRRVVYGVPGRSPGLQTQGRADVQFIAHARQDIPDMLAEIERLRAALTQPAAGGRATATGA